MCRGAYFTIFMGSKNRDSATLVGLKGCLRVKTFKFKGFGRVRLG